MEAFLPSLPTIVAAMPIIISLIILEGLLSVDNALVLAAMVKHLPPKQQKLALRAGLIGAYVLRGVALLFVIANPWVRLVGGGYLIYLMCSHLGQGEEDEEARAAKGGFWATVVAVELADLAFSIDNVIAAVALSPEMWVVVTGVFIGILAMRFVAGAFIKLLDKFPILAKIAYVLVGFIGIVLVAEYFFHFEFHGTEKFLTILGIIAGGMIYDKVPFLQTLLGPVFGLLGKLMALVAKICDTLIKNPIVWIFSAITGLFKRGKNGASS
jgi:YkoY family integral membrane protein